jgi:hypothetical protein
MVLIKAVVADGRFPSSGCAVGCKPPSALLIAFRDDLDVLLLSSNETEIVVHASPAGQTDPISPGICSSPVPNTLIFDGSRYVQAT